MSTHQPADAFPGRNFYVGKGANWGRFLLWLVPAFIVAAILAEIMAQLLAAGYYLIFIVPLAAGLAVAGMINLAVNKGHCRNSIISGLAGFFGGFILYIGYYYFGMVHDFGMEAVSHPEALPAYIQVRMTVEKTHDVNSPHNDDDDKMPARGNVYFNWIRFGGEFVLVLVLTTGAGLGVRASYIAIPASAG